MATIGLLSSLICEVEHICRLLGMGRFIYTSEYYKNVSVVYDEGRQHSVKPMSGNTVASLIVDSCFRSHKNGRNQYYVT
jgi:hypothetical protein